MILRYEKFYKNIKDASLPASCGGDPDRRAQRKYARLFLRLFGRRGNIQLSVVCSFGIRSYRALCKNPRYNTLYRKHKARKPHYKTVYGRSALRVKVSLYSSLTINTAYAIFQLGLGFYHSSFWFYSLAVYYILLAVMRFFLLRDVKLASFDSGETIVSELKRYRFCGISLVLMNVALAGIVFFIAWQNRGFEHHFITTIALAAFTFASLTIAIVNAVRYRKYNSPLFSAAKAISLASAAVSMLTLESAMLSAFGKDGQESFRLIMTSLTGAAVCIFVLVMAIYMIINSNKKLRKITEEQSNGK